MPWTIYCHTHIESGRRYIGLTSQTWQKRWKNHISAAKSSKGGRWYFPNAIRKYGKDAFSHEILEVCDTLELANVAEEKWILVFNSRNPEKGFNIVKGGAHMPHPVNNSYRQDPEYRTKVSENWKRIWQDSLFKANMSQNAKNRWHDPIIRSKMMAREFNISGLQKQETVEQLRQIHQSLEFRSKISNLTKGRLLSPAIRSSISNRMKGHKKTQDIKAKISMSLKGRILSEETRRKISEARKRQIISPETRAKIAVSNTGRLHTEESKAKMSFIHQEKARSRKAS